MARFIVESTGHPTHGADPGRMIFYVAGNCGFWTDDMDRLAHTAIGGIPCCPGCGAVGFQTTAKKWSDGAADYAESHPGYVALLMDKKNKCARLEASDGE